MTAKRTVPVLLLMSIACKSGVENSIGTENSAPERSHILYKPNNLPANAPLLLALHGYGSNGGILQWYSGMNDAADIHGFAVAYPNGTTNRDGERYWNANWYLNVSSTDDVAYLSELARDLQAEHHLDPERTFALGMSNGGYMSYTLACEAHDVFRGIASVTGTMSEYDWNNCNPSEPTPVLQIHGIDDSVVPIAGPPHVDEVVSFWAGLNNTTTIDSVFVAPSTQAFYYRNGQNGNEVWYHRINDWGHEWPSPQDQTGTIASELIWYFFSKF